MNVLGFFGAPVVMRGRTVRASLREGLSWRESLLHLHELGGRPGVAGVARDVVDRRLI
jgi:phospholipid/cholesterol/gamma-HCH transport system permease protein